MSKYIVAWVTI